ncbi:Alpha/Beta hydrolase protein [Dendryphion nanum]|uniref:Alpha/Beta hydrolase protein n=1 Tax=Dendryphion nanum TaxID=256645 RepID=A0A9P9EJ04_9PLEO|nr:Alpha/Beta hydrolase protein [Dendryphion nanum]
MECGTLSVPIDWDDPKGQHFNLGITRLPAQGNKTDKIGSLFINPGGPGAPSSQLVKWVADNAKAVSDLVNVFDIIGLDPRGTGLSNQIKCNQTIYAERVSIFPKTQEEYDKLVDKSKRWGKSCLELTGPLLQHVDTISAAKDHEAVRIALGNEPLNFLGLSYGSQLGAQYAALFPSQIRTLVLDGIVQHSQSEASNILTETTSYALSLSHFFTWASKSNLSALSTQPQSLLNFWETLLTNASQTPIPAKSCKGTLCARDVTAEEILFNVQPKLSSTEKWPALAAALYNASRGDASTLSTRFDDAEIPTGIAIGCLDWTHDSSLTLSSLRAKKQMADSYSPLTLGASQSWTAQHACIGWPIPVKNPPQKLDVQTDATILMVASTADPSTGYAWAVGMMEEIGNKVLVTRRGEGHTSTLARGRTREVVFEYLITGKAPGEGMVLDD